MLPFATRVTSLIISANAGIYPDSSGEARRNRNGHMDPGIRRDDGRSAIADVYGEAA